MKSKRNRSTARKSPASKKARGTKTWHTEFVLKTQDCILGMRDLLPESVDIVVTSPPYNLGIKYTNYNDSRNRDEYLVWSLEWANEVRRVLKKDGSFFLNLGAAPSNPLVPHELIVELKKLFALQNTFHWIKSITIQKSAGKPTSVGHFKPLHSKRFVNDCHEYVFHLTRTGHTPIDRLAVGVPYSDKSNIRRWNHTAGRDLRCRGNNWFIPYRTIVSRSRQRPHPATFPSELAVFCIKIHGANSASVMLDPFVGIGHAAIAAKVCGIGRFIGFDIDSEYVRIARNSVRASAVSSEGIASDTRISREPQLFDF
jgi:site-specific DNA-methyltransferase (adenine-specific)